MGIDKLFSTPVAFSLSDRERRATSILIVDPEGSTRANFRQMLVTLGFDDISDASDAIIALEKIEDRNFTHVVFDAKDTKLPARQFLQGALQKSPDLIMLASSYKPTVDDVFNLLIAGARGYVVKPFTAGSLDDALAWATKGEPIGDAIVSAKSRNDALATLVFSALDKLAMIMRQSRTFETALREIPKRYGSLKRIMDVARTFAKGGDEQLRDALIDCAIEKSNESGRLIGGTRRRVKKSLSEANKVDASGA